MGITRKKKVCKMCGKEAYITGRGLCNPCYYKMLRKKKKYAQEKNNHNPSGYRGEKFLYLDVWNGTSSHVSFISGLPLMGPEYPAWVSQFAHVIPKSKYPQIQFDKRFIVLLTMDEHYAFDNLSEDQRRRFHPHADWDKLYALREKLMELL
jgi:ribosomal protein L37E